VLKVGGGASTHPTGHKFIFFAASAAAAAGVAQQHCAGIEADILAWTPQAAIDRGKRCTMQFHGLVQAGVPIGTPAFVADCMRERVASAELLHCQVRLLECVQSAYLLARYSLSRKMDYHVGLLGADVMGRPRTRWWEDDDSNEPGALHEKQMRCTLAVLLVNPMAPEAMRQAVDTATFDDRVYAQAMLPPRRAGLGLAPARQTADACFVGQGLSLLPFLFQHHVALHLPADLAMAAGLTWLQQLTAAASRLPAPRAGADAGVLRTIDGLLSGTPTSRSQHRLTDGVYVEMYEDVLKLQPDARHRARLASASGAYAGAWLGRLPTGDDYEQPHIYRAALCLRLGAPFDELLLRQHRCPSCAAPLDAFGFHPGTCKKGNAGYAWTVRSERLEGALAFVARRMGVHAVRVGNANWFGMAGYDPRARGGQGAWRKADVVFPGFCGGGQRHLFVDVAIVDGTGATAVARDGGGGVTPGVAASAREATKVRKYRPICERIGAQFKPAAIERHGHCGDGMCSIIKLLSGDGERSAMEDDVTFTAPSKTTFVSQHLVFAAVMADAAMVCEFVWMAAHRIPRRGGVGRG